jgi:2-oxo-3-hexenedioate decarboxylase
MAALDTYALADEIADAYAARRIISTPPSARDASFDLTTAYRVEAELAARRRSSGHVTVGRKVGFANKAIWRALKLDTLVWAHMYDDTVRFAATRESVELPIARMTSPKIEPEFVFKLRTPLAGGDAIAALQSVEWIALGFEIIDCVYADWKFHPADFVAAYGFHAALVVGEPRPVTPDGIAGLVDALPSFSVKLLKDGDSVAEGSGKNVLRSPALCLAELGAATMAASVPLAAGEVITTGTLTDSQPIAAGQTWTATIAGLDLPDVSVHFS